MFFSPKAVRNGKARHAGQMGHGECLDWTNGGTKQAVGRLFPRSTSVVATHFLRSPVVNFSEGRAKEERRKSEGRTEPERRAEAAGRAMGRPTGQEGEAAGASWFKVEWVRAKRRKTTRPHERRGTGERTAGACGHVRNQALKSFFASETA